jgi:hypothetical protein
MRAFSVTVQSVSPADDLSSIPVSSYFCYRNWPKPVHENMESVAALVPRSSLGIHNLQRQQRYGMAMEAGESALPVAFDEYPAARHLDPICQLVIAFRYQIDRIFLRVGQLRIRIYLPVPVEKD